MKKVTKAAGNAYCQARLEAAKKNESLNSREGAAEALGMSKDSLTNYELGMTKSVPAENVVLMANLYHAPDLLNYYCANECPIGIGRISKIEEKPVELIALQMIGVMRGMEDIKNTLIDITDDGVIDAWEKPKLDDVLKRLEEISMRTNELKLFAEKHVEGGDDDGRESNR